MNFYLLRAQHKAWHSLGDICACMWSCSFVSNSATLWTIARQAPLSMGFSRQEYWSGLPCPPPEDLPNSGIKPTSLLSPALVGRFFTTSATWMGLAKNFVRIFLSHGISQPNKCDCHYWVCVSLLRLFFTYLFFKTLKRLFIFDCAGSLLLQEGFL